MNNKKILIILASVCAVLVLGLVVIFLLTNNDNNATKDPLTNDVDKVKELNQKAMNEAVEINVKPVRPIDNNDHLKGKLEAPIQLIVYSDFECPFCSKFENVIKQIEETYKEKVAIAFRHYPLRSHDDAIPAAIASECASEQGKFWEMHDKLFEDSKVNELNTARYKENAKALGLDQVAFDQCIDTEKYKDKVITAQTEAKEFGVNGTPASFVNSEPLPGAVPFEDFVDSSGKNREGMKTIIERHLNK